MGITNEWAQLRAWRHGVRHTTLNPEGPGAVRIHLVPPRYRPGGKAPYVVILNGYYVLPLGYAWAVLLENFIDEVDRYDGRPMGEAEMAKVSSETVRRTKRIYPGVPAAELREDLEQMIGVLFDVARGDTPRCEIGAMSLREYAPHMTAPHRMDLMVSAMTTSQGQWNCNLKCRHCYAAGQPGAQGGELSTEQWKTIIDRCRAAGIPQLTFTGGEPTMREDLPELISYARWFVTRLNTNGLRLTPALCRSLRQASLDSVQVTLYAADAAVHDRLVGLNDGWKKTAAGLRSALETGLDVSVNAPLCRDNAACFPDTLEFLYREGVRYVSCSGLIETGRASSDGSLSVQLEAGEMEAVLRQAAAFCREQGMELSFTSPGRAAPELLRELGLTVPMCGACLSNMAVAPDGTVVPCQSWLREGDGLGNLLHEPWKSIWSQPRCRQIRGMGEEEALYCPLRHEKEGKG